jgi:hypothetical protein
VLAALLIVVGVISHMILLAAALSSPQWDR